MKYSIKEKKIIFFSCVLAVIVAFPQTVGAMHIMEGFLPVSHSIVWSAIALPFVVGGIIKIRKLVQENRRLLVLLAMAGAFVFIISALREAGLLSRAMEKLGINIEDTLKRLVLPDMQIGYICFVDDEILVQSSNLNKLKVES